MQTIYAYADLANVLHPMWFGTLLSYFRLDATLDLMNHDLEPAKLKATRDELKNDPITALKREFSPLRMYAFRLNRTLVVLALTVGLQEFQMLMIESDGAAYCAAHIREHETSVFQTLTGYCV